MNNKFKRITETKEGINLLELSESNSKINYTAICDSVNHKFEMNPNLLINNLSFTHICEIMPIDDPLERFFYEFECMRGGWSVRELRRQIATNLFFRAGVSKNPEKLLSQTLNLQAEPQALTKEFRTCSKFITSL